MAIFLRSDLGRTSRVDGKSCASLLISSCAHTIVANFRLASIGKLLVGMASSVVVQTTAFLQHCDNTPYRTDTYRYAFLLLHTIDASITRIAHVDGSKSSMTAFANSLCMLSDCDPASHRPLFGHTLEEATRPGRSPFPSLASRWSLTRLAKRSHFGVLSLAAVVGLLRMLRVVSKNIQHYRSTKQLHHFHL
jgi:hypothetical protein